MKLFPVWHSEVIKAGGVTRTYLEKNDGKGEANTDGDAVLNANKQYSKECYHPDKPIDLVDLRAVL